jgi:aflatoxin B1 aldehyde reductase
MATRYFKSSFFSALEHLNKELGDIRPAEAALRWMQHHSQLNENDAVIIGGSSLAQFEGNCRDSEGGPLPENVLKVRS